MLRILPFTALRTMEAVVRLRGFGRAAEELNVTQSAVSQHIKSLEEWIGHKLLVRGARKTAPTEAGVRLAAAVTEGFGVIETVCDELRGHRSTSSPGLLVAAPAGFAYIWLLPRLLSFDEHHQDIPISMSTDAWAREVSNPETDVIIHYGTGGFPGMHAERLLTETMAPVCAPQVASQISNIEDLSKITALVDAPVDHDFEPNWDFWAREIGEPLPDFRRRRSFAQANMVIQAAIEGLGIAMGRSTLVADALKNGTLVHPLDKPVVSQHAYWFVCSHEALNTKPVQAFRVWLHAEAARTMAGSA